MNATKKYQFTMLFCMLMASVYCGIGMTLTIVNAMKNGWFISVFILLILSFFAAIGQSKMIELVGEHLKG